MGLTCCSQNDKSSLTTGSDLTLENHITGDKRRKHAAVDLVNENVSIQRIMPSCTRMSALDWSRTEGRKLADISGSDLGYMNGSEQLEQTPRTASKKDKQCNIEENKLSLKECPIKINAPSLPTMGKLLIPNQQVTSFRVDDPRHSMMSISVDPSRFRLERKCSIEEKYEILYQLGKGTFGEVKRVRDKKSMISRAVKVISKENCKLPENYMEEFEILKQLV